MPPTLEASLFRERTPVLQQPVAQTRLVLGDGVISRSPDRGQIVKPKIKPRTYGKDPLPFKPSQEAPRDARIVGRVAELGKLPYFTLIVGEVEIDDVGLHEILEYVSPYELERFEHQQFAEERAALAAALAAAEEEQERRRERRKEKAKRKGIIEFEEIDAADADSADPNAVSGRVGRARPTYKHLFKLPQERRRRRKRDPITNELLPLSDEAESHVNEIGAGFDSSEEDLARHEDHLAASSAGVVPKRRRRRRDPQTGELLPLPPLQEDALRGTRSSPVMVPAVHQKQPYTSLEHKKRPRRRRHPLTGELMPLGWRYDPEAEESSYQAKSNGMSPSMRKLSISQEQQAKRIKLASESSAGESPQRGRRNSSIPDKDDLMAITANNDAKRFPHSAHGATHSQASSPAVAKSLPKTSMLRPTARAASSASSTEPVTLASFLKSSAAGQDDSDSDDSVGLPQKPAVRNTPTHGKTSIMQPVAADPSISSDEGEEDEEDEGSSLNEGEWFVEAIVGHKMSDPRSHPGKPSVLLYHTKWEGSEDLTWEPASSFVDPETVKAYRLRTGLDKGKQAIKSPMRVVPVLASDTKAKTAATLDNAILVQPSQPSKASTLETSDDDMDEDYEIEKILAHHMSDPKSHPGQSQTMLYKIKWVGFPESEASWEPKSSFPDIEIMNKYRRKAGLRPETQ
ncbi:Putative chromo/chromo shadow domain, Chromo-like domain superfamily protein [Septoria linicola]|uniref:Chromo/chromo shadow domain, Chromo-like domain superfamily protein n=1 Tax=Septoria linicola TaxID=215465 RepID=A0A9Q9AUG8_9PEZI|nr:putative chromo/chromo shadow domain, Chromo-like domain superfamily protein [Septoria linicola]USW52348.1 Putative chromo/chromo shadow domain, Chromo-like domain superfamily protein [Septoria linicola]